MGSSWDPSASILPGLGLPGVAGLPQGVAGRKRRESSRRGGPRGARERRRTRVPGRPGDGGWGVGDRCRWREGLCLRAGHTRPRILRPWEERLASQTGAQAGPGGQTSGLGLCTRLKVCSPWIPGEDAWRSSHRPLGRGQVRGRGWKGRLCVVKLPVMSTASWVRHRVG